MESAYEARIFRALLLFLKEKQQKTLNILAASKNTKLCCERAGFHISKRLFRVILFSPSANTNQNILGGELIDNRMLIIGVACRRIASLITGNDEKMGAWLNILVGIVGAFVGGLVMNLLGST